MPPIYKHHRGRLVRTGYCDVSYYYCAPSMLTQLYNDAFLKAADFFKYEKVKSPLCKP